MEFHHGYAHGGGLEAHNRMRQQRAHQKHQQALEAARQASLQQHAQQMRAARQREAAMSQLNARFDPMLEAPDNLWAIFEESGGRSAGPLIERQYSPAQIDHWRQKWFATAPVGEQAHKVLLAQAAKEKENERANQAELKARKEAKEATKKLKREIEERYWIEPGTVVRVKRPQSKLDGALGKVLLMEWGPDGRLMATVEIDPLPPDHPMQKRDPRFRPQGMRRFGETMHAEMLYREHPEVQL